MLDPGRLQAWGTLTLKRTTHFSFDCEEECLPDAHSSITRKDTEQAQLERAVHIVTPKRFFRTRGSQRAILIKISSAGDTKSNQRKGTYIVNPPASRTLWHGLEECVPASNLLLLRHIQALPRAERECDSQNLLGVRSGAWITGGLGLRRGVCYVYDPSDRG